MEKVLPHRISLQLVKVRGREGWGVLKGRDSGGRRCVNRRAVRFNEGGGRGKKVEGRDGKRGGWDGVIREGCKEGEGRDG
jgi:hypothetical protein